MPNYWQTNRGAVVLGWLPRDSGYPIDADPSLRYARAHGPYPSYPQRPTVMGMEQVYQLQDALAFLWRATALPAGNTVASRGVDTTIGESMDLLKQLDSEKYGQL